MNLSKLIKSKYLYPLWRIGWLEKAFFRLCRALSKPQQKLFNTDIVGHDVSYYQGYIDFDRMKETGADFVIIRCGYRTMEDSMFDLYMDNVEGVLPRNVYHFYDPAHSPLSQANAIIATLAGHNVDRVWLDFEFTWGGSYSGSNHWLIYRNALNAAGYKTGIYTRATWWDSRVGALAAEFARDPLWAAQYSTALTLIPRGWLSAMIWQSGSPEYDAGQTSPRIDYNLWNDSFDFAAEWGTLPPPPIGETMEYEVTGTQGVNLRPSPSTSSTVIRNISTGSHIWGVPDVLGWIKGSAYQVTGGSKISLVFYCVASLVKELAPPPVATVAKIEILPAVGTVIRELDAAGNVLSTKTL